MIDPLVSLAFTMHSNRGVYALLVGSGISRTAEIPTGWDIILDLTRKVASAMGEDPEPDPEAWYREKIGEEPNYSKLLAEMAKTPAERQQLLKAYFEPTDEDREQGRKTPTPAHHAIAQLVASGHIRVIITPNFDRLLEQSLEAVGVFPTVISTPDAADGAMPLTHSQCTIIKIHGDYLDTRIKNTPEELAQYDERLNNLLDRVLDEYGLIISGWSAEWDVALCDAFRRCKSRRFTTYWTDRGRRGKHAQDLVQLRGAQTIPVRSADQFFTELSEKVAALAEFERPHPLSAKMAVASLKRYLPEPKHRIRLGDLVTGECDRLFSELTAERFPPSEPVTEATFGARIRQYEAITEVMRDLLIAGCYWGEECHRRIWSRCLARIANEQGAQSGNTVWLRLRWYPALILLYAAGLAYLANEDYEGLAYLLIDTKVIEYEREEPVAAVLNAPKFNSDNVWHLLTPGEPYYAPVSRWLYQTLREALRPILPDAQAYQKTFDRFEYLLALVFADLDRDSATRRWVPAGLFHAKAQWNPTNNIRRVVEAEIQSAGDQWPPLQAGLFDGSIERLQNAISRTDGFLSELHWY